MKTILIALPALLAWFLLRSSDSESAVEPNALILPKVNRTQTGTLPLEGHSIRVSPKKDLESSPRHILKDTQHKPSEQQESQQSSANSLPFSPYKVDVTPKDSPLGRLPSNLKKISALPMLTHFNSAPSLRFLSGNFIGAYLVGNQIQVVRFALFFKDNNLDELSPLTCAGLMHGPHSKTISGNIASDKVKIHFLNGRNENQKSLVVSLEDKLVLHIWQMDKREKSLWVKIYQPQEDDSLKEVGYSQLTLVQNSFKSCASLH